MKNKSNNSQNIISAIKKVEKSLRLDLKKTEKILRREMLRVEERAENLEDGQKEIKEGQSRLETKVDNLEITLDGFVGKVDNLVKENAVGADQYRRHDVRLGDHEVRIKKIESTVSSS